MTLKDEVRLDVKRAMRLAQDAHDDLGWVNVITTDSVYTLVRLERAYESLAKAAEAVMLALGKQKGVAGG